MSQDELSIAAGAVSIVVGVMAIGLSIWLYTLTKRTETDVAKSLAKIETQADMLSKITGNQLDRFTKFFTEPKQTPSNEQMDEVIRMFAELPQMLLNPSTEEAGPSREKQIELLIALYFYTAQINCWTQASLPNIDKHDENNSYHRHTKRIVDMSAADFQVAATKLRGFEPHELTSLPIYPLLEETLKTWRDKVMTSADVYIHRAQSNNQPDA